MAEIQVCDLCLEDDKLVKGERTSLCLYLTFDRDKERALIRAVFQPVWDVNSSRTILCIPHEIRLIDEFIKALKEYNGRV